MIISLDLTPNQMNTAERLLALSRLPVSLETFLTSALQEVLDDLGEYEEREFLVPVPVSAKAKTKIASKRKAAKKKRK
jgi:hypothetical protein